MKRKRKYSFNKETKPFDIIEIVPSFYELAYPLGHHFVVIGVIDNYDAEVINDKGEYEVIFGEEYNIVGNALELKKESEQRLQKLKTERQKEHRPNHPPLNFE